MDAKTESRSDLTELVTHHIDIMRRIGKEFPFHSLNYLVDGTEGTIRHEDGKLYRIVVKEVRNESV